jgi:hypothetical protein
MFKMLVSRVATLALGAFALALTAASAQSISLPGSTALPVRFVHSIDAKRAKVGDTVTAKTMQVIALPSGGHIAQGALVTGHITAVGAYSFNSTPYVHQAPSQISIHFDSIHQGNTEVPVSLFVRAIASTNYSREASSPHRTDDTDTLGVITLVGGASYTPLDKMIQTEDGDAIAYNRPDGLFARLMPAGASAPGGSFQCQGTSSEQSVAIFSPDACGLYGFPGTYMLENGHEGSGTFTLAARGHSAKLPAGSTALLQVN